MDVKQEPFDPHERVKTEPNLGPGFKQEHVEIEQEIIKCEVPKIELRAVSPLKHDYENVPVLFTVKKELENTNDFHEVEKADLLAGIGDVKREVGEHLCIKTESELLNLNTLCDLPTLKDEGTEYTDYFTQPCSSKQVKRHLNPLKNKTLKVVPKKRRLYPCPVCQKNFHSPKSRTKHIDRHFDKRCVICEFCGKFMNRIEFLRHYFIHVVPYRTRNVSQTIIEISKQKTVCMNYIEPKIHTKNNNDKPMSCEFDSKELLQNHNFNSNYSKLLTFKNSFKCDICQRRFMKNVYLNRHLKIHTDGKPFKCHSCSKQFITKMNLKQHLMIHRDKKPFKCDICLKTFNFKQVLRNHLLVHTIEKPFKCDVCSKKFKRKFELRLHLSIHNDEISFKCDTCSKQFKHKLNLERHLITHTEEKPFKCDICFKAYKRYYTLQRHLKMHSNEKTFNCDMCSKGFNRKYALQQHLRTHTKERPFKCNICSKQFKSKSNLYRHLKIHSDKKA